MEISPATSATVLTKEQHASRKQIHGAATLVITCWLCIVASLVAMMMNVNADIWNLSLWGLDTELGVDWRFVMHPARKYTVRADLAQHDSLHALITDPKVFTSQDIIRRSEMIMRKIKSPACQDIEMRERCPVWCPAKWDAFYQTWETNSLDLVISYKYKYIYVEVLKAASTRIRSLLNQYFPPEQTTKSSGYISSTTVPHKTFEDFFVFTFIREPMSRFLSSYAQYAIQEKKRGGYRPRAKAARPGDVSNRSEVSKSNAANEAWSEQLMEHVPYAAFVTPGQVLELMMTGERVNNHLRSIMSQIEGVSAEFNRVEYDFIGTTDNFAQDFAYVFARLGKHPLPEIWANNRAKEGMSSASVSRLMNEAVIKQMCKVYEVDFQCLPYEKPASCSV